MPLHQLCGTAARAKRGSSSGSDEPAINAQEICDVKINSAPRPVQKSASHSSSISFSRDICRICHSEDEEGLPLIAPCYCSGSLRFVHQSCLQQWIKSSNTKSCELCKFVFIMNSKVKPFNKWEKLDISSLERRKILCSVTFHVITITFVVFSLNVLIQRTSQEVQDGALEWPFWTKVIVVAIAFTGSIVFIYVQCKMYVQLCQRWRAYNRVIYIQNAPEKMLINQRRGGDHYFPDPAHKDVGTQAFLDRDEKRTCIITASSQDPNCTLSSIATSLSPPKTPEGSFDHGYPPGTVEWHVNSPCPTPAPSFLKTESLRIHNERQTLVDQSRRLSSAYAGTPEVLVSTLIKKEDERTLLSDYPEHSNQHQDTVEKRFVHTPNNFKFESVSPDLSEVETVHLDIH